MDRAGSLIPSSHAPICTDYRFFIGGYNVDVVHACSGEFGLKEIKENFPRITG